jgi:hypothetical protein
MAEIDGVAFNRQNNNPAVEQSSVHFLNLSVSSANVNVIQVNGDLAYR